MRLNTNYKFESVDFSHAYPNSEYPENVNVKQIYEYFFNYMKRKKERETLLKSQNIFNQGIPKLGTVWKKTISVMLLKYEINNISIKWYNDKFNTFVGLYIDKKILQIYFEMIYIYHDIIVC